MNDANLTLFAIFQILVVAIVCPANKVISSHLVSKQAVQCSDTLRATVSTSPVRPRWALPVMCGGTCLV